MKAFIGKQMNGCFLDTVIRAADENDARGPVADEDGSRLGEFPANHATAMGVPEKRGRHDGALTRWIIGPTTLIGHRIRC